MAVLLYPSDATVSCPLLFSAEKLFQLDRIVARYMPKFAQEQESAWETEFNERLQKLSESRQRKLSDDEIKKERHEFEQIYLRLRREDRQKTLVVHLKNNTDLFVDSFEEAARHAELSTELSTGFELRIRYRPIQVTVAAAKGFSKQMRLSTGPSDNQTAQELFGEL